MSPIKLGKIAAKKPPSKKTPVNKKEVTPKKTEPTKPKKKPNPFTVKAKSPAANNGKPARVNRFTMKAKAPEAAPKRESAFTARAKEPVNKQLDFSRDGVRFHNCRRRDSYWLVDVTNGDTTITLQNRYGSWMGLPNQNGAMKEYAAWVAAACQSRWRNELKARGIPSPEQNLLSRIEEEAKARRKRRTKSDEEE